MPAVACSGFSPDVAAEMCRDKLGALGKRSFSARVSRAAAPAPKEWPVTISRQPWPSISRCVSHPLAAQHCCSGIVPSALPEALQLGSESSYCLLPIPQGIVVPGGHMCCKMVHSVHTWRYESHNAERPQTHLGVQVLLHDGTHHLTLSVGAHIRRVVLLALALCPLEPL